VSEHLENPHVSVIVPVRDGAHHLRLLLDALDRQTIDRESFEVVIADDGSAEPPLDFATGDGHVKVLVGPATNSFAARNRAVAVSVGEILAFCDSDCIPEPEWLERGLAAVEEADLVAGYIRFILPEKRTIWTLVDMDTSKNQQALVAAGLAETANLFVTRAAFDRVGGFMEIDNGYGDYDLVERCVASGCALRFAVDAIVWHPTRQTAASVLRAHWVYSRSYAEFQGRRGVPIQGLRLRTWVPIVPIIRSRRRGGVALTASTDWVAEQGIRPSRREQVLSLPAIYLVLPYTRKVAMVVGSIEGRRHREQHGGHVVEA
jgi:glycosyltransferase involved in cell wall biosynthesis